MRSARRFGYDSVTLPVTDADGVSRLVAFVTTSVSRVMAGPNGQHAPVTSAEEIATIRTAVGEARETARAAIERAHSVVTEHRVWMEHFRATRHRVTPRKVAAYSGTRPSGSPG